MKIGATLHGCDVKTRDAFANMDIAGYNYGIYRYGKDLKKYPKRLNPGKLRHFVLTRMLSGRWRKYIRGSSEILCGQEWIYGRSRCRCVGIQ